VQLARRSKTSTRQRRKPKNLADKFFPPLRIGPRFLRRPTSIIFAVPTKLFRLSFNFMTELNGLMNKKSLCMSYDFKNSNRLLKWTALTCWFL
jgi:hypothetical protein